MDILVRIKQLVLRGRVEWTSSAVVQMMQDNLLQEEVLESIMNAQFVRVKRTRSKSRTRRTEKVYIIESFSYSNILIYTKGTFRRRGHEEVFYILISAKRSIS